MKKFFVLFSFLFMLSPQIVKAENIDITMSDHITIRYDETGSADVTPLNITNNTKGTPISLTGLSVENLDDYELIDWGSAEKNYNAIALKVNGKKVLYDNIYGMDFFQVQPKSKGSLVFTAKDRYFDSAFTKDLFKINLTFDKVVKDVVLTYNSNGGDYVSPVKCRNGDTIQLPEISKGDDNKYILRGWKDARGIIYRAGTEYTVGAENETLTAVWVKGESILTNGKTFNSLIDKNITSLTFTHTAIPDEYRDTAVVVSLDGYFPSYFYVVDDQGYVSPDKDGIEIKANWDASYMFSGCTYFTSINLDNFTPDYINNMHDMFAHCYYLESLDLSQFGKLDVSSLEGTFYDCRSLKSIDLSNFETTSRLNTMYKAFTGCKSLETLSIPRLNVSGVKKIDYFLQDCASLQELDLGGFYTPNLTSAEYSFQGLTSLKSLYLPDLNFSKCNSTRWMFSYNSNLELLDIGDCDFGAIKEMRGMFAYDYALRSINLVNFNLRTSANTMELFRECHNLSGVVKFTYPITPWFGYDQMFENCSTDTEVPLVLKVTDINILPHARKMYSTKSENSNIILEDRPDGTVKMTFDTKCDIVIDPAYIVKGTTANLISPAREGLKFLYWYDDMGNQYQGTITPTGDMVLHAEWEVTGGSVLAKGSTFRSRLDTSIKSMVFTSYRVPSEYKATAKVISDGVSIRSFFYVIDGVGYISPEFDDVQIYSNSDSSFMIYNLASLESVDLGNFDTSKVTSMREMFSMLPKLRSIDLSKFNTSNTTDISGMFFRCGSLESLDLSMFDTSKVTTFESLVYECSSLKELDLSMLDTSKVTNMKYMVIRCTSLEKLNMRGINTSHVTTFDRFASGCTSLKEVDMTGIDTSACKNMQRMFDACSSLDTLDLSSFETSKVIDFSGMFRNCYKLKTLSIPVFDFKSINSYWNSYIDVMFQNCYVLNGELVFRNVRYYPYSSSKVFEGAVTDVNSHLTLKYESPDDINLLTRMYNTKSANSNITLDYKPVGYNKVTFNTNSSYNIDPAYVLADTDLVLISPSVEGLEFLYWTDEFGNKYTDKITVSRDTILTANWVVKDDASITLVRGTELNDLLTDMAKYRNVNSIEFTYSKVPDEYRASSYVVSLSDCGIRAYLYNIGTNSYISPEFEGVQIYANQDSSRMFSSLRTVTDIKLYNFDTSRVNNMLWMFSNTGVSDLDLSSFNTSNVTEFYGMFEWCSNLVNLNISNFDTSSGIDFKNMFKHCVSLSSLDVSNFDTSKGVNFSYMFAECNNLRKLDLSNFDTSKGSDFSNMFDCSYNLLDLGNFKLDFSSVTNNRYMFKDCKNLSGDIYFSNFRHLPSFTYYMYAFENTSIYSTAGLYLHYANIADYPSLKVLYGQKSSKSNIVLDYKPYGSMMVTFDTNCGISIDNMYVEPSTEIELPLPVLDGLKFIKWVDDEGDEYEANDTVVVNSDMKFSAEWIAEEGSVSVLNTGNIINGLIDRNIVSLDFTSTSIPHDYKANAKVVSVDGGIRSFYYVIDGKGYISPEIEGVSIHANANCMNMFRDLTTIKTFDFGNFDTSDVTNMETMFYNCKSAVSLDTVNFNTSKVTNMSHMFYSCASLTTLDLSNFDTSQVVTLDHTFGGCTNLISADISSFDTSSCENIGGLFRYCENLKSVDLSNFDTSKVKTVGSMFQNCFNLEAFKTCVFDMQNLSTYIDQVFMNCHKLSGDIIFKNLRSLPWYCENSFLNSSTAEGAEFTIHYMDIADLPYVKALYNSRTSNSVKLDYKPYGTMQVQFDTRCGAVVDNMYVKPNTAFELPTPVKEGLTFVKWVDTDGVEFDPSNGIDCDIVLTAVWVVNEGAESTLNTGSFINGVLPTTITSLEFTKTAIPAEYKDTATVVSTGNGIRSFYYAIGDQGYISPEFDNVTIYANADCSRMFSWKNLQHIIFNNFDTSRVVSMFDMFAYCYYLQDLDVSMFDTSKVENMQGMFFECYDLYYIDITNFDYSSAKNIRGIVNECPKLSGKMLISDNYNADVLHSCANTATDSDALFTIYYTDEGKEFAKKVYASKFKGSHVQLKSYNKTQVYLSGDDFVDFDVIAVEPNSYVELPKPIYEGLEFLYWEDNEGNTYTEGITVTQDIDLVPRWKAVDGAELTLATGSKINSVITNNITTLKFTKEGIPDEYRDSATVVSVGTGIKAYYYEVGTEGYISPEFDNVTIYANADCSRMFNYKKLKSIQFENFDTSRVTNMLDMFAYAFSLEDADITGFDTSKVTNMQGMFYQCYELRYLDFSNFDFTSARTIDGLVKEAHKLTGQIFIRSNYASNLVVDTGFYNTAINSEGFTVYYLKEGEDLARRLYNTKSNNSNIKIREYGKIEVSFDTDGVLDLDNIYVEPNTTLKLPIPEYEGVEFLYWEDSNGNHYNSEAQFDSDITLYAKWDLKDEVILNTGTYINTIISNNITSLEFTTSAIPVEYKESAKLVSKEMSKKAYYYEVGSKGYISPEVDNLPIYANEDCYNMFLGKSNLINIDLSNFDTSKVKIMYNMFANLTKLETLDLSGFDTSNVTSMQGMFYGCSILHDLDISNFDFSSITTMRGMFWYDYKLSGKMVINSGHLLSDEGIYRSLNSCATDNSTGFYIYYDVDGETLAKQLYSTKSSNSNIILKDMRVCEISFDTDGLINVGNIIADRGTTVSLPKVAYENLEFLYWEDTEGNHYTDSIVVSSDIVLKAVWEKASNLVVLKSDFSFKDYLGSDITEFRTLDTVIPDEYKDTAQVVSDTSSKYKVYYYEVGSRAYLQSEIANERIVLNGNLNDAFSSNTTLELVDLSNLRVSNLTSMENMFSGCSSLQTVDLSSLDTTNVTTTRSMFANCTSLQYVDISTFDTPNIVSMNSMFYNCSSLENVKLGVHNSSSLNDIGYMFYNCKMLQDMEIDSLYLNNARTVEGIFKNCYRLSGYWIIHTSSIPYNRPSSFFFASGDAVTPFIIYYKEGCYNLAKALYDEKSSFSNIILAEYKEHEISFDTGGNGTVDSIYAYPDKHIKLPTPECDGAEFLYWEDDAGNQYTTDIRTDNDITLYAKWRIVEPATLVTGKEISNIIGGSIASLEVTKTAIPDEYKDSATLVSTDEGSKAYYYAVGTRGIYLPKQRG